MGNRRLTRLADVIAISSDGARMEELSSFQEGLWVFHAQFGTGVIVKREEQCRLVRRQGAVIHIIDISINLSKIK